MVVPSDSHSERRVLAPGPQPSYFFSPLLSIIPQTAERVLHPHCGINIDTWMVGRKPVGLYKPVAPTEGPEVDPSHF